MFIPINDGNAMRYLPFQYVTVALIVANVLVFLVFQSGLVFDAAQATAFGYGPSCRSVTRSKMPV